LHRPLFSSSISNQLKMPQASRKYTLKEARAYSGAEVNQTTLAQAKEQELGHYVRHVAKLNGQTPTLPVGVAANSDQGIKLWKKAYDKALEAEALRNWVKRNPGKNALIQGSANDVTPRRPAAPRRTLGERRALSNKTRACVAATAASATAIEEVSDAPMTFPTTINSSSLTTGQRPLKKGIAAKRSIVSSRPATRQK
jgi:hypothetical protein